MRKEVPPPKNAQFLLPDGQINRQWLRWFQRIGKAFEDIRVTPDIVYTADQTLKTDDYGKIIQFDCTLNDCTCTLMTPQTKDIYGWLTVFRKGTYRLTIVPTATSRIEYGSLGGRVWNDEDKRYAANLTLQLFSLTQWGIIGATGLWYVR